MSSAPTLTPELALLIAIARVELSAEQFASAQARLAAELNWDRLISLATSHGLAPLLLHHLSAFKNIAVPPAAESALREESRVSAQRAMILATRLPTLSAQLASHGIQHATYKGPLFAESCYGNCALRVFHDLDLIVAKPDLPRTLSALTALGFRDKYGLTDAQQAASFHFGSQHIFTSSDGFDLDLHWRVVPHSVSPSFDENGMWARLRFETLFGRPLPTLGPEDMFLVLCLHAGQHEWARLSTLCDLAQLLATHPSLDWQIVCSHVRDSNTRRMVLVSLALLAQHWPVNLPSDLSAQINNDSNVTALATEVQSKLWPAPELEPLMQSNLRWLLKRTAGERFSDRARYIAGNILGPTLSDFEQFKLPRSLFPFYPALRGARLAGKYLAGGEKNKAHR